MILVGDQDIDSYSYRFITKTSEKMNSTREVEVLNTPLCHGLLGFMLYPRKVGNVSHVPKIGMSHWLQRHEFLQP